MRQLRRALPWFMPAAVLLLATLLLGGHPRVYADGDKPTPPGGETGMGEPAMGDPAMGDPAMDDAGMGDGATPEDDDDEDLPQALGDRVQAAIHKGVAWLKARQLPDGSWGIIDGGKLYPGQGAGNGEGYKHPAGCTALALYTLLKCKVPVDDPVVKKGFGWLRAKEKIPKGTYEVCVTLLAVTAVADPFKKMSASEAQGDKVKFPGGDWREWAQKLHDVLLSKRTKAKMLGWRYNVEGNPNFPEGGNEDLSSTQMAAMALLAAERCGIKTDSKVWNELISFAMRQQADDGPAWDRAVYDRKPKNLDPAKLSDKDKERYGPAGGSPAAKVAKDRARGFAYIKNEKLPPHEGTPTGSMTACGIGTVMISRYVLLKREDPGWAARDQNAVQQSVYDGCAWLDSNWDPFQNPNHPAYFVYYLYCVERAFDLIGNNLLGKHAWYQEMAEQLLGRQNKEKGFWDTGSMSWKTADVLDTCFALLFLKRSTKGGIPYGSITGGGDEPPADNRGR